MENTELVNFNFQDRPVRIVEKDGEPWFVAKDIAEVLGYSETSNPARLFAHVPEEWKGVNPIHTPGGIQDILCLSKPGLYFFLDRSDKPLALPFQKWIAWEVIPSIRKKGDCSDRIDSPKNPTPVKLYTPKGAVSAMLAGKILFNRDKKICFWSDEFNSFIGKDPNTRKGSFSIGNFEGLYEEIQ